MTKKRKQSASEKALAREVKAFNQRVDRAARSGKLPADVLPEKASVKAIKEIAEGMTPKERYSYFQKQIRQLRKSAQKGAFEVVRTDSGVELTRYDYERSRNALLQAKRRRNAEKRAAEAAKQQAEQIRGEPVKSYADLPAIPNVPKAKTSAEAKALLRELEVMSMGGDWAKYRNNLRKYYRDHYGGAELKRLEALLNSITNTELASAYYAGENFQNFDEWLYIQGDVTQRAAEVIESFEKFLGKIGKLDSFIKKHGVYKLPDEK